MLKNGDFSIPMCTQTCGRPGSRHAQNGFQLKMRLCPPGQEVLAAGFHESNYESEGPTRLGLNDKEK